MPAACFLEDFEPVVEPRKPSGETSSVISNADEREKRPYSTRAEREARQRETDLAAAILIQKDQAATKEKVACGCSDWQSRQQRAYLSSIRS